MDALRRDDIERARATAPEEKARQAFEAMRTGIRSKRAALRARDPEASVHLRSPRGVVVDVRTTSSGVEAEVVERAAEVAIDGVRRIRSRAPRSFSRSRCSR
jgi:hypothetical protein